MKDTKFLYGAAVQGIQGFIFQTDKLQDIVGASELVEKICTDMFREFADADGETIIKAAGNIKHLFNSREACEKAVREFPRKVLEAAPGITISQAVVTYDDGTDFKAAVDKLEERLRTQRNRPTASITTGLMAIRRSRRTGLPAIPSDDKDEWLDEATAQKREYYKLGALCEKSFGVRPKDKQIAYDFDDLCGQNSWIAVIHADGNGLGQVVKQIGHNKDLFRTFSENLDKATKAAAKATYAELADLFADDERIPLRPVVLGGDDMTMICRGNLAIEYTQSFLRHFEEKTHEYLASSLACAKMDRLTACAGIAFIKSSYPFHYGYKLAERLCDEAKKDAKQHNEKLAPSCLMFHKVQDSFVNQYNEIKKRELTADGGLSFCYGPYYLNEQKDKWTIKDLTEYCDLLNSDEGNAVKSNLRQWLTLRIHNKEAARQKLLRTMSLVNDKELKELVGLGSSDKQVPIYDILSLHTILNQRTPKT